MLIDTLLLLALPASGKSEVRRYLASVDAARCARDFKLGPTVQLDDFPYVHMMRRVDEALLAAGRRGVFFRAVDQPFAEGRDWGTLIELVNEDHADLVARRQLAPKSAGAWLMERFEAARAKVGAPAPFAGLEAQTRTAVAAHIEAEAAELLRDKLAGYPDTLKGKTLVIEFARGGPEGSKMPLPAPYGYAYSLSRLSPALLERARILYIWVTPEESRRKNQARANPDDPGSILHHGVPEVVMRNEYGCDDMSYLIESSGSPRHVRVEAHGRTWSLPVARFDNRVDATSFVREEPKAWRSADVDRLHSGLGAALSSLV